MYRVFLLGFQFIQWILIKSWIVFFSLIILFKNDWKFILLLSIPFFAVKCTSFKAISEENSVEIIEEEQNPKPSSTITLRKKVVQFAKKYEGKSYKYGGTSPKGFDCSGFTLFVLNEFGIKLPHNSGAQSLKGKKIPLKKAQAGDLLFFENKGKVNHVGLVYSNEADVLLMIHGSSSRGIVIDNVYESSYWKPRLKSARNVID